MFRQKGKTTAVSDAIGGIAPLAEEVMEDKKLRGRLMAAASHGLAARRQARSRGTIPAAGAEPRAARPGGRDGHSARAREQAAAAQAPQPQAGPLGVLRGPGRGGGGATEPHLDPEQLGGAKDATGSLAGSISLPRGGQMRIEEQLDLDVPVSTAYNQWTQFEEFPFFMEGVDEVQQLDDETLRWVASIGGQRAEWEAKIVEQVPDQRIVWETKDGKETRGSVGFEPIDSSHSRIEPDDDVHPRRRSAEGRLGRRARRSARPRRPAALQGADREPRHRGRGLARRDRELEEGLTRREARPGSRAFGTRHTSSLEPWGHRPKRRRADSNR